MLSLVIGACAEGCERYEPMPLTSESIRREQINPSHEDLRVAASQIHHPLLVPVDIDFEKGLTPDGAAVVAVLLNPSLRSERTRRELGAAQLLQAGLLPNPQLDFSYGLVTGGPTFGAVDPWSVGLSWDITALITRRARMQSASADAASIDLDIAWAEWQVAEAAKAAVYDLVGLEEQLAESREVDLRLAENARMTREAVDRHEKVVLDLAAAESASQDSHAIVLGLEQQRDHQSLLLRKLIGVGADVEVKLAEGIQTPSRLIVPPVEELTQRLPERRLDLVALRRGYESQEQTLRVAILAQFPKINVGFSHGRDNTAIVTDGFGITVDLPVFDRNQAGIATEKATRQQLFDEYLDRLRDADFDVAMAEQDISSLNEQVTDAQAAIPGLERLASTYRDAVSRGNADVLSSYTAQSNLAQKRLAVLKLKQQLAQSLLALEIASGTALPQDAVKTVPATVPTTSASSEGTP